MNRIAGRSVVILLIALLLIAGFVFFICEYIAEAKQWIVFPGSPHVYNGGNIGCGVVVDRQNVLLLDTNDGRNYASDLGLRKSTVHWLGDRNGSISAPSLSYYSSQLAGYDLLNGVYQYSQTGGVASLTLSATAQKAALEAMGEYKGTVAVYNYKTGELLCAVTTPTFDPDNVPNLDADTENIYEGMYYNRFIQSSYTPGSIFKIITLAAALEHMPEIQDQTFTCTGSYAIDGEEVTCEDIHWNQDLKTAFLNSCNCAFAQIVETMGADVLEAYVEKFGVIDSVSFDGLTTASGNFEVADASGVNVAWSGIGQYKDLINPCAFLTFMGVIAGDGVGAMPYLVEDITVETSHTYSAKTQKTDRILSKETTRILQEYLYNNVLNKYGTENFPGLSVCAKTGTGEVGGDKKSNAMLAGFVADDAYPLAFVVCVEDAGYGKTVCIPIASQVLTACKTVLDKE